MPAADDSYAISWAIANLLRGEYHHSRKEHDKLCTGRCVARVDTTWKRRCTVVRAAKGLAPYRRRPKPPQWGLWPAVFEVLTLYGILAAWAPAGWDEPLGIGFAGLAGYVWPNPATWVPSTAAGQYSGERGWFG